MASVIGVYFGCFSCAEFVHGISNWTEGIGECYTNGTFGQDFGVDWLKSHRHWLQAHRKLVRQAMYSKTGGRGHRQAAKPLNLPRKSYVKPKFRYIYRHGDDNLIDFDYVYKLNSSCVNVLGVVAVETLLCFGIFDKYSSFKSKLYRIIYTI